MNVERLDRNTRELLSAIYVQAVDDYKGLWKFISKKSEEDLTALEKNEEEYKTYRKNRKKLYNKYISSGTSEAERVKIRAELDRTKRSLKESYKMKKKVNELTNFIRAFGELKQVRQWLRSSHLKFPEISIEAFEDYEKHLEEECLKKWGSLDKQKRWLDTYLGGRKNVINDIKDN